MRSGRKRNTEARVVDLEAQVPRGCWAGDGLLVSPGYRGTSGPRSNGWPSSAKAAARVCCRGRTVGTTQGSETTSSPGVSELRHTSDTVTEVRRTRDRRNGPDRITLVE